MADSAVPMAVLSDPDALRRLGLLAAPTRLRAFSALVLGAADATKIARRTGLSIADARRALGELGRDGIAVRDGDRWSPHRAHLAAAIDAATAQRRADERESDRRTPESAVLRAFLRNGRIASLPVVRSDRLLVLDHVVRDLEPGVRYTEPEINAVLRAFHSDHTRLRGLLVEEGFLARVPGHYWRCGGTVEV